MATAYKILGNSAPAATTDTTLVTGSTNGTIVSSFTACNTSGTNDSIRVALVPNGGTLGTSNYLYYGFTVPANSTIQETPGWTLESGATLHVYSNGGNVTFLATGATL